jgi:hypothetical protein
MTALATPSTMDEITPAWLTSALRAGGAITHANVIAAPRETIGAGVGILGELARIRLTYDRSEGGAPRSVIAKIPTADPGGKGIANALGFYAKEMRFYQELAGHCGVGAPRCYYASSEPEAIRYVLLLEDLAAIPIGDQIEGCTLEQARLIVDKLGDLHARWCDSAELAALDWIPASNAPVQQFVSIAYGQAIGPFLEKFGERLTADQRELATRLGARLASIQDAMATAPHMLCHGDARLDNIFFGSPDGKQPLTFVDWQIAVRARGPYDIGYFTSQSMQPADRKTHEEELLRGYYDKLAKAGVKNYSWEQCWEDYRVSVLFCLAYPVIAGGSIDLTNERGIALGNAMTDRSITAITELDGASLLERFAPVA